MYIYTMETTIEITKSLPPRSFPPRRTVQGIGPMDGSVSRIPDRRIDAMHTLYRDAQAPLGGPGGAPGDGRWCGKITIFYGKNMETYGKISIFNDTRPGKPTKNEGKIKNHNF